jgi:hypothetical protein
MRHSKTNLPFLSALLFLLAGCGGGTTTTSLEVTSSFLSTSPFSGGFMVVGQSAGGQRFSLALDGANQGRVFLEPGSWSFTAVGWHGGAGDLPFEGTPYCGLATAEVSGSSAAVKIEISAAECAGAEFVARTQFKDYFNVLGCDVFYTYNGAADTFSPVAPGHAPNFCSGGAMVVDYVPKFTKFRLRALTATGATLSPGFVSTCKNLNDVTADLRVPTARFPFAVELYKTDADCANQVAKQSYLFPTGFADGGPGFDSVYSPGNPSILLATSKTKRGRSPFMAEIPRINCGAAGSFADCLTEPTLAAHVKVPFAGGPLRRQTILKNISPAVRTCDPSILVGSERFSTDTCEVEDRSVRVEAYPNVFLCQRPGNFFPGTYSIRDLHRKGDFIYVLRRDATGFKDFLTVYNQNGRFLNEYDLGNVDGKRVSATVAGDKVLVLTTSSEVRIYGRSGFTLTGPLTRSFAGAEEVEIHPAGNFYVISIGNVFTTYPTSGGTAIDSSSDLAHVVTDMKFVGDALYLLEDASGNNNFYKFTSSAGEIPGTLPAPLFSYTDTASRFDVEGTTIYGVDATRYFVRKSDGSIVAPSVSLSGPVGIVVSKGKLVVAEPIAVGAYAPESTTNIAQVGTCFETVALNFGGTAKSVAFESAANPGVGILFEEGFRFIGMRFFSDLDKPFYYHEDLSHSDDRSGGGELRRIQQMLSPQALGAFFVDFPTCAALRSAAAVAPVVRSPTFRDETTGEAMSFTVRAEATNEAIDGFNCAVAPSAGACGVDYQLLLSFGHDSSERSERIRIKLKCGTQIGSFESYDVERDRTPNRVQRTLYVYQTEYDHTARYEKYALEAETNLRSETVKLYKTGPERLQLRRVETEVTGTDRLASVTEFELKNDGANDKIFTSRFNLKDTTTNFDVSTATGILPGFEAMTFPTLRDNLDFNADTETRTAKACMFRSNGNPGATNLGTCDFTAFDNGDLSKGSLSLSAKDYPINNGGHPLRTPGVVFEIVP